jgi:hypothetical protein
VNFVGWPDLPVQYVGLVNSTSKKIPVGELPTQFIVYTVLMERVFGRVKYSFSSFLPDFVLFASLLTAVARNSKNIVSCVSSSFARNLVDAFTFF